MEETDIRTLDPARFAENPEIVVIDVSFISLKHVLPAALALAAPRAHLVALVKPQFEAPRRAIKKGIVRDGAVHAAVCDDMAAFVRSLGCEIVDVFPAAIAGGDGNQEFFIGARRG
jgi:23S rRNA (cytidine1920-2'-O)/16S rRNA (cytidine1409-2'-O)-methyltransferase